VGKRLLYTEDALFNVSTDEDDEEEIAPGELDGVGLDEPEVVVDEQELEQQDIEEKNLQNEFDKTSQDKRVVKVTQASDYEKSPESGSGKSVFKFWKSTERMNVYHKGVDAISGISLPTSRNKTYFSQIKDFTPKYDGKTNQRLRFDDSQRAQDFTLVVQTSFDRLWLVNRTCFVWEGPIVIVVYHVDVVFSKKEIHDNCLRRSSLIIYHGKLGESFPVNKLRNVGLQEVRTSHALLIDVDFLPDAMLYRRLLFLEKHAKPLFKQPRAAFVVPAFQYGRHCSSKADCMEISSYVPKKIPDLQNCLDRHKCHIFDPSNPTGHSTTGYSEWCYQTFDELRKLQCFRSNRYEPYFVLRMNKNMPLYDERFHGYGKNKIQYVSNLRYLGWIFYVIPESFLVHVPHPKSRSKKLWQHSRHQYEMDMLYAKFLHYQRKAHEKHIRTPKCKYGGAHGKKVLPDVGW